MGLPVMKMVPPLRAARGMEPKRALGRSVPVGDERLQDRALWGID